MIFRPGMQWYKHINNDRAMWVSQIEKYRFDCSTWNEGVARNLARVILK